MEIRAAKQLGEVIKKKVSRKQPTNPELFLPACYG